MRTALPYVGAFAPYGVAIGAVADQSPVPDLLGWSTSWLNYAGASQLVLIQLLGAGASPVVVVATVALVNLRLLGYATAMSPHWRGASRRWTAGASYVLIDPSYLIATERRERAIRDGEALDDRWHRQFYLGAAGTLFLTWPLVCAVGVTVGSRVPLLPTGALADLMLVSMVAAVARDAGSRVAAAVAFGVGFPAVLLPGGTGTTVAAAVAITAAMLLRGRS